MTVAPPQNQACFRWAEGPCTRLESKGLIPLPVHALVLITSKLRVWGRMCVSVLSAWVSEVLIARSTLAKAVGKQEPGKAGTWQTVHLPRPRIQILQSRCHARRCHCWLALLPKCYKTFPVPLTPIGKFLSPSAHWDVRFSRPCVRGWMERNVSCVSQTPLACCRIAAEQCFCASVSLWSQTSLGLQVMSLSLSTPLVIAAAEATDMGDQAAGTQKRPWPPITSAANLAAGLKHSLVLPGAGDIQWSRCFCCALLFPQPPYPRVWVYVKVCFERWVSDVPLPTL